MSMDVKLLQQLIDDAENGKPELPDEVLHVQGFSAPKVRRLLNALCSQPGARYLEIGTYCGSTFIPALYGNEAEAMCIDYFKGNWQQVYDSRLRFLTNTQRLIPGREFRIIDGDCFQVALEQMPREVNVYFYDGDHSHDAQYEAIKHYAPALANQFVLLVDDWNWQEARTGTQQAIEELGYTIIADHQLIGEYNGDQVGWWNGLYVALIEKESIHETVLAAVS
jgi:precorrin-6B methylase 2